MKKNIILNTLLVFVLLSCTNEHYDDYYYNTPTDFSKDISNLTNFYLSTGVELKILNEKNINDTLVYNVGDTLKLSININAIYQESNTDKYNLFKSTGASNYTFNLYTSSYNDVFYRDFLDLKILEKYPEAKNLSINEIKTNPIYKSLFKSGSTIDAEYNLERNEYECKIGIILKNSTGLDINNKKAVANIYFSEYITNKSDQKNINISIPIISYLNLYPIVVN